jgi:hypothetical protein
MLKCPGVEVGGENYVENILTENLLSRNIDRNVKVFFKLYSS